ncbi:hypothetical protein OAF20_01395, partial [bacterium]|nr:hypothetical protein [bacterium]
MGKMHQYLRIPSGLVCIVFSSLLNSALAVPTIVSVSVTSSEFVIDSDASRGGAGYNRDEIAIRSSVNLDKVGNFRYDYQLLDEDNALVLLDNGAGGTTTTFRGAAFSIGVPKERVTTEMIAPAVQLDLNQEYRVKLLVKKRTPPAIFYVTEVSDETAAQQFIHFTNTDAASAEVNVRGMIDEIRWTNVWACDTDPANDSFRAEADLTFWRYDDFLAASADTEIVMHQLIYQLRESSTGNVVAISGGTTGAGYSLREFALDGSIQEPYSRSVTRSFSVNPAVQLDPVNETYYLTVTLTHE